MNMRLYTLVIVCIMLLTAGAGISSGANRPDSNKSVEADKNGSGPTVVLEYDGKESKKNPTSSFLYFIPLISPVSVVRETSADNKQEGTVISYKQTTDSKYFYVACKFRMRGDGFQTYTFDPAEMIARNLNGVKDGEPLTNLLGWIKFEGEGTGLFEVSGTIDGSKETVTKVIVNFNTGGQSPVTAGLYSVKSRNGQYKYENKYNEIVVRINTLAFEKSENNPKMDIEISSIRNETDNENLWGTIKGLIANFFIKPLEVDKLGNDTMLNLGKALDDKQNTFTFPKANNIKEDKVVPAKSEQWKNKFK